MKIPLLLLRNVSFGIVGILAIAYLVICFIIYVRQTRMIFFPTPNIAATPEDLNIPYQDVWLPVREAASGVRLHSWWVPARGREVGVLLYLHGNGENVGANVAQTARFHNMGLSVLVIDYRGYGRSNGGFPSETKVYQDAETAWQYLVNERNIPAERILLYGHSLGGAIAIDLATRHPDAAGLIVQSSFTSMRDMAYRTTPYGFLPIDLILTQKFNSIAKVSSLKMPLLFIHGTADWDVPSDMSQTLYEAAPNPKEVWMVPGAGHNDVAETAGEQYAQVVEAFIQRSRLVSLQPQISLQPQN
ncbi:MAG TPA: alpha/beta fold hydrolase [Crinalium sp.]|jgi:hypothetical protein